MTKTPGISLQPPPPDNTGDREPITERQMRMLHRLADSTGAIERGQVGKLTRREANALIERLLSRFPEERARAQRGRRRKSRQGRGVSTVWAMDLRQRL
jgi:hypothetical protein